MGSVRDDCYSALYHIVCGRIPFLVVKGALEILGRSSLVGGYQHAVKFG